MGRGCGGGEQRFLHGGVIAGQAGELLRRGGNDFSTGYSIGDHIGVYPVDLVAAGIGSQQGGANVSAWIGLSIGTTTGAAIPGNWTDGERLEDKRVQ